MTDVFAIQEPMLVILEKLETSDNEVQTEAEGFSKWMRSALTNQGQLESIVLENFDKIFSFKIAVLKWIVEEGISFKEVSEEIKKEYKSIISLSSFNIIAEEIQFSTFLAGQMFEVLHKYQEDSQITSGIIELPSGSFSNYLALVAEQVPETYYSTVVDWTKSSLFIEFVLTAVYIAWKEKPINDKVIGELNNILEKYNRIYFQNMLSLGLINLDNIVSAIETNDLKTNSFQQFLLEGPVMSDEDYQFYLNKKSYFNQWNQS